MKKTVSVILTMLMAFSLLVVVSCQPEAPAKNPTKTPGSVADELRPVDPATFKVLPGTYDMIYESVTELTRNEKYVLTSTMEGTIEISGNEAESSIVFSLTKTTQRYSFENEEDYKDRYENDKNSGNMPGVVFSFNDKMKTISIINENEAVLLQQSNEMSERGGTYEGFIGGIVNTENSSVKQSVSGNIIELKAKIIKSNRVSDDTLTLQRRQ